VAIIQRMMSDAFSSRKLERATYDSVFDMDKDPNGEIASFQLGGPTTTAMNATCFTCHQPQNGWTVSVASVGFALGLWGGDIVAWTSGAVE
jgi:hypothetical protein